MHRYISKIGLLAPVGYLASILIAGLLFILSLIFINYSFPNSSHAAPGIYETVNYQGRLLTATGAVVPDGSYNIEFKIYQDGNGVLGGGDETLKWTETRTGGNKVLVKNGYFSVYLGSINAFASNIDWNQDTLWLSVDVEGTGGSPVFNDEMSPFTRFSSTPYALNSKYLAGLGSTDFLQLAKGVQVDGSSTNPSVFVNKTGATANILQLQKTGTDVFVIANDGAVTASNNLSVNGGVTLGDSASDGLLFTGEIRGASPLTFEGATNDDVRTTFAITDPTSSRTITFPNASGAIVLDTQFSGDATVSSSGLVTISGDAIGAAEVANSTLTTLDLSGSAGITNGQLANSSINLALGTSGTDINWGAGSVSLGGTATLNLPDASSSARGLVTTGTQTFTGDKTFQSDLDVRGNTTLGNNSQDTVTSIANIKGSVISQGVTGTTTGTGTNTTTLTLTTDAFSVNDVVLIANVGQNYYTRVTADPGTGSYTVSPAVTFETGRTVTKYNVQNVGATQSDYSTLTDRFFQGYFLGGVVTGAGTTSLSDGLLYSSGALNINASSINLNANLDLANNLLINIGNAGTDFTSSGGLNLADALTFGGDTSIYRSGANSLQTDDSFWVGGTFNVDPSTGNILSSGSLTINGGSISTSAATFNLANATATTLNIGAAAGAGGINFAGGSGSTGCSIDGSNGNLTCSGTITTSGTIGTAGVTTFTGNTGTFSGAIAANGGITFDNSTDTLGAFTLAGTQDAGNNLIVNIGNASTDFTSGGGLNVAGTLAANGGLTVQPSSAGTIGATITARTAQTADLFRIVDEWGDNLLTVNPNVGFAVKSSDGFTSSNAFSVVKVDAGETIIVGVDTGTPGLYTAATSFNLLNSTATTINFAGAATTLNIGPGSTTATSINLAGGSGATGCTVDGATGNITCAGTITTSGTIGTASTTTFTGNTGTFSGAIAANGGITFDNATDTLGAHTLAGTLDANSNLITNIGNTGTDFVSGGGLTLAGTLTGNGVVSLGDGGDTFAVNSTAFDVSTAGAVSGVTTLSASGEITTSDNFDVTGSGVYQIDNVSGASITCGSNNYLSNIVLNGGIITGNNGCRSIGLSDARVKNNVVELEQGILDQIKNVRAVTFDFDCDHELFTTTSLGCETAHQTGVIAQELAQVFPGLVRMEDDGYYRVDYNALSVYNLKAVTEIAQFINSDGQANFSSLDTDSLTTNNIKSAASSGLNIEGDVFIDGDLIAKNVKAESVEGLELITNRISRLENSTNASSEIVVDDNVIFQSINTDSLNVALNLNVDGSINIGSGLTVAGLATFDGEAVFNRFARFADQAIFSKEVKFEDRVSFGGDNGGFAVIDTGESELRVGFSRPFNANPVVNLSIKNGQFVDFAYKDLNGEGFTIVLKEPAASNIEFSWTAFEVRDVKTVVKPEEEIDD